MSDLIDLEDLERELHTAGLDVHGFADLLIVTLPCSYDQLILSPGRSSRHRGIFWQQRTSIGSATGRSGILPWPTEARPLVNFVWHYAYSQDEYMRQYHGVLEAMRGRGLDAKLKQADGGGFIIHVPLHGDGYLLVGAPEALPPRLEGVTGWHVQHHLNDDGFRSVVYDSMPETFGPGPSGPDVKVMADSVARYVSELLVRYGGIDPLHGNQRGLTSPATLAWLLEELVALPSSIARSKGPAAAVVTIAAPDGSASTSVTLPPDLVNRLNALVLAEITARHAID